VQRGGSMSLPFEEKLESETVFIRTFSQNAVSEEFVWHRDQEDRVIEVISGEGWKYQQENRLPIILIKGIKINVPKLIWHRVIKGKGDLIIRVHKLL
jgi:hypothetical protein